LPIANHRLAENFAKSERVNPRLSGPSLTGDVGRRQADDGVRDRRERVHRLRPHQDAAAQGLRREDDGQEPRFDFLPTTHSRENLNSFYCI